MCPLSIYIQLHKTWTSNATLQITDITKIHFFQKHIWLSYLIAYLKNVSNHALPNGKKKF